jgi:hypothetical protein
MSQENVEIVRRWIEALNRRDVGTMSALWRSDGEVDWSRARGPLKGVYRGRSEYESLWNEFFSTFERSEVETHGLIQAGSEVVVLPHTTHFRGREGIELTASATWVNGRERADHSPSAVPRGSRGPRSRRAAGVGRSLLHQVCATSQIAAVAAARLVSVLERETGRRASLALRREGRDG